MKDWENTLEALWRRGWDYGYVKCLDETGGNIYSVHLKRGIKILSMDKSSIEEAVAAISRLAEEVDGGGLTDLNPRVKTFWPQPRDYNLRAF